MTSQYDKLLSVWLLAIAMMALGQIGAMLSKFNAIPEANALVAIHSCTTDSECEELNPDVAFSLESQ